MYPIRPLMHSFDVTNSSTGSEVVSLTVIMNLLQIYEIATLSLKKFSETGPDLRS